MQIASSCHTQMPAAVLGTACYGKKKGEMPCRKPATPQKATLHDEVNREGIDGLLYKICSIQIDKYYHFDHASGKIVGALS